MAVDALYDKLNTTFERSIPRKKPTPKSYPPWFKSQIIYKIKQKSKIFNKYKRTGNLEYLETFKLLRAQAKYDIRISYDIYLRTIEGDLRNNPNNFWVYVHHKNNVSSIPAIITHNNKIIDDPQIIVNSFAEYFSHSFIDPIAEVNDLTSNHNVMTLDIKSVSEEDVLHAIKKLKAIMTMGPDLIPAFLLKDCSSVFVKALTVIFNLILRTSCFPEFWKLSRVCPAFVQSTRKEIKTTLLIIDQLR